MAVEDELATRSASDRESLSPETPTQTGAPQTGQPGQADGGGTSASRRNLVGLERYQILGEHGRGGLGRVSRARDRSLGRDVAIKELIARGHVDEVRFLREALITARLEHPGIVPVHEAGWWPDGTPFYAMKLVAGRPLRALIAERHTVDERIGLLHHVIAVADAIAYAHRCNIIHRDLKPGNVIVGDFGETIVIDWGLAKDLSTREDAELDPYPLQSPSGDDLTNVGSVIGTPAYMAPEQARGEPVDQRADVFAIGAMLWQLCTLDKMPSREHGPRRRVLQRSGIDADLAAIIDKALAPERDQRYRDAGALAADLKAFKAGTRITARRYSMPAILLHWIRRHRALTASVLGVLAIAVIAATFYVRDITAARDLADQARDVADQAHHSEQRAKAATDDALGELTLDHAQLQLTTDPTAALDTLARYRGPDGERAAQIRAEAVALGVSQFRATPHSSLAYWSEMTTDGGVISMGKDGRIVKTARDGTSAVRARDADRTDNWAFSKDRQMLAYACQPAGACLFDVRHETPIALTAELRQIHVSSLDLSASGNRLGTVSTTSNVEIFDTSDLDHPVLRLARHITGAHHLKFADDDHFVIASTDRLDVMRMDGTSQAIAITPPGIPGWDANPHDHTVVLTAQNGDAVLIDAVAAKVRARTSMCPEAYAELRFIPHRTDIAYMCGHGMTGIWDPVGNKPSPRMELVRPSHSLAVSEDGNYIAAWGSDGTIGILDLQTDLITYYKGHASAFGRIAAPTAEHPVFVSGDARGVMRIWPLPERLASLKSSLPQGLYRAIYSPDSTTVILGIYQTSLSIFSPTTGLRAIGPHDPDAFHLESASTGELFVAYGGRSAEPIELWSWSPIRLVRTFDTQQGGFLRVHFVPASNEVLTAGTDGNLVQWTPTGERTVIAHLEQPIENFEVSSDASTIVFSSASGDLWRCDRDHKLSRLYRSEAAITSMAATSGHIYAGHTNGDVIAFDVRSGATATLLHANAGVALISAMTDDTAVVISTGDGLLHIGQRALGSSDLSWQHLPINANHHALTRDGLLVVLGNDNLVSIYSLLDHAWIDVSLGVVQPDAVTIAPDGESAAIVGKGGHVVWLDLGQVRARLRARLRNQLRK